jgi:site-specific recombinase XerD
MAVDGVNKERDYCILCLFLNCGLRISEIVGLNISDILTNSIRVFGKGSKERIVYLNEACVEAINSYLPVRRLMAPSGCSAFFLSTRRKRISCDSVQVMVKNTLLKAGLDAEKYSPHKLRHTAATLMLQNGVDVRTLQEVLGHEHLNTTQIYTHVDNAELHIAAAANPLGSFSPKKN